MPYRDIDYGKFREYNSWLTELVRPLEDEHSHRHPLRGTDTGLIGHLLATRRLHQLIHFHAALFLCQL